MRIDINAAAQALLAGQVVAVPTQTFYGLAARADDSRAVETVFRLKGRRPALPSPVLVADIAQVSVLVGAGLRPRARALAEAFWPGALTLVVGGAVEGLPDGVRGDGGTVGMRQDGHPLLQGLLTAAGVPVTGTSANRSGEPPATLASEVDAVFDGVEGYAGSIGIEPTPGMVPSTVVRVEESGLTFLRNGALAPDEVDRVWRRICGDID